MIIFFSIKGIRIYRPDKRSKLKEIVIVVKWAERRREFFHRAPGRLLAPNMSWRTNSWIGTARGKGVLQGLEMEGTSRYMGGQFLLFIYF